MIENYIVTQEDRQRRYALHGAIQQIYPKDGRIPELLNADFYYLSTFIADHVADPDCIYAEILAALPSIGINQSGSRMIQLFSTDPSINGYDMYDTIPFSTIPVLERIRQKLCEHLKVNFNCVLMNVYPDGNSSIGAHSDKEEELVPASPIASVTFGNARHFDLYAKHFAPKQHKRYRIDLQHGSLLIMARDSQKYYLHSIPRQTSVKGMRINLTFRVTKERPTKPDY